MNLEPPPILPLIFELDSTIIVLSVVISILLILSALFSGAETAFFSLTPKDNETLEQSTAEKENKTFILLKSPKAVSYTHLTLPTKRKV